MKIKKPRTAYTLSDACGGCDYLRIPYLSLNVFLVLPPALTMAAMYLRERFASDLDQPR